MYLDRPYDAVLVADPVEGSDALLCDDLQQRLLGHVEAVEGSGGHRDDSSRSGVDGLTVIREARRLKADLPVIIITGFSNEASAIEAVNLGVSGYLTKPFRVPRVLAAASKALGE